jgi:hypothetical protein
MLYLFLIRPQGMHVPVMLANAGVPMLMLAFPAAFFLLIPVIAIEWRIAPSTCWNYSSCKDRWCVRRECGVNASRLAANVDRARRAADQVGPARTFLARFAAPKDSFCDVGGGPAGSVF